MMWAIGVPRTPTAMDPNPVRILATFVDYPDAEDALGRFRDTRKRNNYPDAHLYRLERHE